MAFGRLSGLCDGLFEGGGFAVGDGLAQRIVDEGDLRVVREQLALLDDDFDIAAKIPNVVLEIQILGALLVDLTLIRGDRHAPFRDADLVEDRGVSLEINVSGLRVHEYLLLAIASEGRGPGARPGQRSK